MSSLTGHESLTLLTLLLIRLGHTNLHKCSNSFQHASSSLRGIFAPSDCIERGHVGGTEESVEQVSTGETEPGTERLQASSASNSIDDGHILLPPSGAASTRNSMGIQKAPIAAASAAASLPNSEQP